MWFGRIILCGFFSSVLFCGVMASEVSSNVSDFARFVQYLSVPESGVPTGLVLLDLVPTVPAYTALVQELLALLEKGAVIQNTEQLQQAREVLNKTYESVRNDALRPLSYKQRPSHERASDFARLFTDTFLDKVWAGHKNKELIESTEATIKPYQDQVRELGKGFGAAIRDAHIPFASIGDVAKRTPIVGTCLSALENEGKACQTMCFKMLVQLTGALSAPVGESSSGQDVVLPTTDLSPEALAQRIRTQFGAWLPVFETACNEFVALVKTLDARAQGLEKLWSCTLDQAWRAVRACLNNNAVEVASWRQNVEIKVPETMHAQNSAAEAALGELHEVKENCRKSTITLADFDHIVKERVDALLRDLARMQREARQKVDTQLAGSVTYVQNNWARINASRAGLDAAYAKVFSTHGDPASASNDWHVVGAACQKVLAFLRTATIDEHQSASLLRSYDATIKEWLAQLEAVATARSGGYYLLPPSIAALNKNRADVLILHVISNTQSGLQCGSRTVANAYAIQSLLREEKPLLPVAIRAKAHDLDVYLMDWAIDYGTLARFAGMHDVRPLVVLGFNAEKQRLYIAGSTGEYQETDQTLEEILTDVKSTDDIVVHFAINLYEGHWTLISVVKRTGCPSRVFYLDSLNSRLSEGGQAAKYLQHIFTGIFA